MTTEETQYIRTVDNLIASRLSLKLQLQAVHFAATTTAINGNINGRAANVQMTNTLGNVRGGLMLRCTAQIGDLYQEYKEIELGTPQRIRCPPEVSHNHNKQQLKHLSHLQAHTHCIQIKMKMKMPIAVTLSSDSGLRNFLETYFYTSAAAAGRADVARIGSFFICYLICLVWITRIGS